MSFGAASFRGAANQRGAVVDHRFARRALINEFRRGRLRRDQVCDAHPELIRAATNFGQPTSVRCPICEEQEVVLVTYVFGPRLPAFGRVVSKASDMATLDRRSDDLAAYVVEACTGCRWHHLLKVLPVGGRRPRSAASASQ
ncbi:MAG: hypothetical protein RL219_68 [Actinomycetota bacterium]